MADFSIGAGMLLPALVMRFIDGTGAKVTFASLAGATALFNLYDKPGDTALVSAAGAITLDADGVSADFGYSWTGTDTALRPATYLGEFIVTFASGKKQKFPMGLPSQPARGSWIAVAIEPAS